jgi:hypothetical protein
MPIAVIACIGVLVLGLVLDVGIFRLIDSEFENAAAAGALAAAWYDPVCPAPGDPAYLPPVPGGTGVPCANPDGTPRPDNPYQPVPNDAATFVATRTAKANLGLATRLCASQPSIQVNAQPITDPSTRAVSVIITCNAPYLAGALLSGTGGSSQITRWATAAIGTVQKDGTFAYFPNDPNTVASLVPL